MILFYILALVLILILVYFLIIRPWALTWGATKEEAALSLVGDDIVKTTHFVATRAVTINAAPSEVWKWIIQIGSARAGWYSYDWVDNAGAPSSRAVLPEFQKIENDYFIPFAPDQKMACGLKNIKNPLISCCGTK